MAEQLRILLADDNQAVLDLLKHMLRNEFEIVGTLREGSLVLEKIDALDPDVLILDISMGDPNGFQIARELTDRHCRSRIIFLTAHQEPEFVREAMKIGVSGYVYKCRLDLDLRNAIFEVLSGNVFIPPEGGAFAAGGT